MNNDSKTRLLRLISRLNENRLTESETNELTTLLKNDPGARQLYCKMQHQEAQLSHLASDTWSADERNAQAPEISLFPRSRSAIFQASLKIAAVFVVATMLTIVATKVLNSLALERHPAVAVLRSHDKPEPKYLRPGKISLPEGKHTIDFYSGAQIQLRGPAKFQIVDSMTVKLSHAQIAANVSSDAKGFRMELNGASLVDLGTEFAVNSQKEETSLKVFKGEVLANTTDDRGSTVRSILATPENPLHLDSTRDRYQRLEQPEAETFIKYEHSATAPLPDLNAYRREILKSAPTYYWDFESTHSDRFLDLQSNRSLQIHGAQIALARNGENAAVTFLPDEFYHMLKLDGQMEFQKNQPFSIEFLFCPDRIRRGTLLALFEANSVEPSGTADHFIIVETMARQDFFSHLPGAIRTAYRPVPSGYSMDGINAFSSQQYLPGKWVHFAMTFDGKVLRTYQNGHLQNTLELDADENPENGSYAMVLGQISSSELEQPPEENYRPFVGSIDEFAVYNKELSAEEILTHFQKTGL